MGMRKKDFAAKVASCEMQIAEMTKKLAAQAAMMSGIITDEGSTKIQAKRLDKVMKHYDMVQNLAYLHFDGLPFNATAFARHIYHKGCVMVVKDKQTNTLTYGQPVFTGSYDFDNKPIKLRIQYNRNDGGLDTSTEYLPHEYVLFYDVEPFENGSLPMSRQALARPLIDQMTEIAARININIVASGGKIIIQAPDAATHKSIKEELAKEFNADSPFIVLDTQGFGVQVEIEQPEIRFNELFQAFKQFDELRLMIHGLGSGNIGNSKGERLVVAETDSMEDSVAYIDYMRKLNIQKFIDDMYTVHGLKLEWRFK